MEKSDRYSFEKVDIRDSTAVNKVVLDYSPDAIVNFAAESHVDNSIASPAIFLETNIFGTYNLLEASRKIVDVSKDGGKDFLFLHISTDEVFGDADNGQLFSEASPYRPNSPYSASKAASDQIVKAWGRTYNLPFVVTNCSNNYGPFQNTEKLIPKTIINVINNKKIPVYGDGTQIRDWLYVNDHVNAIGEILKSGERSCSYNIGGLNEVRNIDMIKLICKYLDGRLGREKPSFDELVEYVEDRPGHDTRYAIDASKISQDIGWQPSVNFEKGIQETIDWYLNNKGWWYN